MVIHYLDNDDFSGTILRPSRAHFSYFSRYNPEPLKMIQLLEYIESQSRRFRDFSVPENCSFKVDDSASSSTYRCPLGFLYFFFFLTTHSHVYINVLLANDYAGKGWSPERLTSLYPAGAFFSPLSRSLEPIFFFPFRFDSRKFSLD